MAQITSLCAMRRRWAKCNTQAMAGVHWLIRQFGLQCFEMAPIQRESCRKGVDVSVVNIWEMHFLAFPSCILMFLSSWLCTALQDLSADICRRMIAHVLRWVADSIISSCSYCLTLGLAGRKPANTAVDGTDRGTHSRHAYGTLASHQTWIELLILRISNWRNKKYMDSLC